MEQKETRTLTYYEQQVEEADRASMERLRQWAAARRARTEVQTTSLQGGIGTTTTSSTVKPQN